MLYNRYIQKKKKEKPPLTFRLIGATAGLIIGAITIKILFSIYIVKGDSMKPDFPEGKFVLLLKIAPAKRDKAVLVKSGLQRGYYYFGRIAAVAGDSIEINNKEIIVNGENYNTKRLLRNDDPRILPEILTNRDNLQKMFVPEGHVFIIGDNLDRSFDSRDFGPVKAGNVVGRVILSF